MEKISQIFALLGPIIGLATASPITAGILVLAAGVAAFFAIRWFKNFQWAQAHKQEVAQSVKDQQDLIVKTQQQSASDAIAFQKAQEQMKIDMEKYKPKP